ncbi:MAG: conjugal transfer protein TraR [Firmicutes bacterium]|nr:conjugal transfer protein TraR [Bacillota bacterium]
MKMDKVHNLRERLRQEQQDLIKLESSLAGPGGLGEPMDTAATELSAYDQHPGDYGSQMYERSKDLGLLQNTRERLAEVEEALEAIGRGTYGRCQTCGKIIPEDRLEALPMTLYCVECKRQLEDKDVRNRPVEEELLYPPFGRTFTDETDSNAFDGEDSWEAVARFGTASGVAEDEEDEEG